MSTVGQRWSDEQRNAIIRAVLDEGMTAVAAVAAAARGQLGQQPFEMPLSTARWIVRRERDRRAQTERARRAAEGPAHVIAQHADRLLAITDTLLTDLERQGRKAPPEQAIRVARLLEAVARIEARQPRSTGPAGQAPPTHGEDAGDSWIDRLAATAPTDPPPKQDPPTQQGQGETEHPAATPAARAARGPQPTRPPAPRPDEAVRARAGVSSGAVARSAVAARRGRGVVLRRQGGGQGGSAA